MKIQSASLFLSLVMTFAISNSALASKDRGGGDGYRADFVKVAHTVYDWLGNHPEFNKKVSADAFLLAIDPDKIQSTSEQLYYKALPVDATYDYNSQVITIYRTGWDHEADSEKLKLTAHELFRKMGVEGDGYELSSQIMNAQVSNIVSQLKEGDFKPSFGDSLSRDNGLGYGNVDGSQACIRHVETDPLNGSVIIEMKSAPASPSTAPSPVCIGAGTILRYTCTSVTAPQCRGQATVFSQQRLYTIYNRENMTILPDGNFVIDESLFDVDNQGQSHDEVNSQLIATAKFHSIDTKSVGQ